MYEIDYYLDLGCPFISLKEGEYVLFIKRSSFLRKSALINYIGAGVKIKEIHSKEICKEILNKIG